MAENRIKQSFSEYSKNNHNGVLPDQAYLIEQSRIIGRYFLYGNSALNGDASDETCAYCHMIALIE